MFAKGEWVVYGIHGVCLVTGFEKQLVNRKRTEYMVLEPLNQSESKFYLPTANPTAMGKLRRILTPEELQALLASEDVRQDCWIGEENLRKQRYREFISGGERDSLLRMVYSIYRHKQLQSASGRKFHQCDENFLRDAEKLLASEIALVLQMTPEDARDYLRRSLSGV